MSTTATTIKKSASIRFRIIDREAVVFNQGQGEILVLDEVGSRILDLVGDGTTVHRLVEQLLDEYEVDRSTLESDVSSFVNDLVEAGLLVAAEDK